MNTQLYLVAVLIALLAGLAIGKVWERYKLRSGRWIDRRRLRQMPSYMLGLNFLMDDEVDHAIEALTQATTVEPDALEIQMILGNLYRRKGQTGRAVTLHQTLLQRSDLTRLEQACILLCLGLDFRHGGFIDRAIETFQDVVRLDPTNRYALVNLQKLYEDQRQWTDALRIGEEITRIDAGRYPDDRQLLGFLRNAIGTSLSEEGDRAAAVQVFTEAIDIDPRTTPAYLNLGDAREAEGNLQAAVEVWERMVDAVPDRAYLAFERLERAYRTLGVPHRFPELVRSVISGNPQNWRARLALARYDAAAEHYRAAFDCLLQTLPHNPHDLVVHQEIWRALLALELDQRLVRRYIDLTRQAVFYLDPHVCRRCRYRSTELLWQCPQCHEWNTFVEERLAPAKDDAEAALETISGES